MARKVKPFVPRDLTEYVAMAYATLRQEEVRSDAPHSYTTARTLLSIIRIAEVSLYILQVFVVNVGHFTLIWTLPPP
jgi:DNA replicative helicase MCM subunit Mcm2 (Cdc46/Mcm family)